MHKIQENNIIKIITIKNISIYFQINDKCAYNFYCKNIDTIKIKHNQKSYFIYKTV